MVMTGGSKGGETTAYTLIAFLASNCARVLGPSGVTLDSRTTAQALRFLRSLIDDGLMSPDVLGYEWSKPVRLLAEGKAVISFGGSYETRTLAEAMGVPLEEIWDPVARRTNIEVQVQAEAEAPAQEPLSPLVPESLL